MIRQAFRYGPWYGVDEVILTDYLCGILIHVPPGLENATKDDYKAEVLDAGWSYIEGKDLRMTIGAVLWKACRKVTDTLEVAKAGGEGKAAGKQGGNKG